MTNNSKWRKSIRSGDANACVELAVGVAETGMRDSKSPDTGSLRFPRDTFVAFLTDVKA